MELLSGRVRSSISRNREWQVTVLYTLQRCVALPIRDLNLGANRVYSSRPHFLWCEARYKVIANHIPPLPHTPTRWCKLRPWVLAGALIPIKDGPRPRQQFRSLPWTPSPAAATHHRPQLPWGLHRDPHPTTCPLLDQGYHLSSLGSRVYGKAHPLMYKRWKYNWLFRPTPDLMVNTGITAQESLATFVV
jgi:hypothetical protein